MIALRVFLSALLLLLPLQGSAQTGQLLEFERSELQITTADETYTFAIELALTPEQQSQGLMFRQSMAADAGMLFVQNNEGIRNFWMRNTFIPLDMLFIKADGTIAHIAERTVPQSLETVSSRVPVQAVLELNGGTARRLGIKVGDKVTHPLLGIGG